MIELLKETCIALFYICGIVAFINILVSLLMIPYKRKKELEIKKIFADNLDRMIDEAIKEVEEEKTKKKKK